MFTSAPWDRIGPVCGIAFAMAVVVSAWNCSNRASPKTLATSSQDHS